MEHGAGMSEFDVVVVRTYDALDALRDEWNALADHHRHPLLRHEWFAACARHLYTESDLRVVTVRRAATLVAVAPLSWSASYGTGRMEIMGSSALYEPCGFLYRDEEALRALLQHVVGMGVPVVLNRIWSVSAAAVMRAEVPRALRIVRNAGPSIAVPLMRSWEEYLASKSTHLRKSLRYGRGRMERAGTVNVETTTPAPDAVEPLLSTFVEIEASGWKGRAGSALAHRPAMRAFFGTYLRSAAEHGLLRVSMLRVDRVVVAARIAIVAYGSVWALKVAYDEQWSRCSPGFQLTAEMLRYATMSGLETFEFLGSADAWEERWGTERREYSIVLLYPASIAGGLALTADVAQQVWKKTGGRLFRPAPQREVQA